MKTLLTFALLALIGLLHHNSAAPVGPGLLCCMQVIRAPVPIRRIQDAERSHSSCPVRAIIVTTARGTRICVDDSLTWAKELLTQFEKSPSAPFTVPPSEK